ncbi:hypothetical protein EX30DRAFT_361040 [Ascodesmis nigricans]|uniref:CENP-T/Histone H4 histone fold domain-containing protein n=1 Tax=Ascodesmis nigricans TaxID=341454 RepID=A0A4S2N724_9PEZI|nr:hypothetical protein EX30DRAFT_361040 [Ascodesmis nigricans]
MNTPSSSRRAQSQPPNATPQTAIQLRSIRRTPHAGRLRPKAVKSPHLNRAFEQRHALTPGRRKSGRAFYQDSPRDILRQMSRVLPAPTPQPPKQTPRRIQEYRSDPEIYDDDDDAASPELPDIKTNLLDSDDDDLGPPPRSSVPLDSDDNTMDVTMELPLRAPVVKPDYGRDSLGPRASDMHLFAPMSDPRDASNFLEPEEPFGESVQQLDPESTILHAEEDLLEEPTYDHDNILGYNSDLSNDLSHLQPDLNTTHDDDHEDPWVDSDSDHEAATSAPPPRTIKKNTRKPRALRQSAYGIDYAPLPPAVIRKLASQLSATKLSKDTLRVLDEASEAFFRQTADSLRAFARHAGRKTVDESDVVQLMMRQRQINPQTSVFALAQRYLPRELANEIRMRPKR